MHETADSNFINDPYHWMKSMSEKEETEFKQSEEDFFQLLMMRNDLIHKQLIREQEFYQHVPNILPIRIGEYIYYRKLDNPADCLSLYRFPIESLKERGFSEGEVPYRKEGDNDFPEEVVFSVRDLTIYYKDFAMIDERMKIFVEKITDASFV